MIARALQVDVLVEDPDWDRALDDQAEQFCAKVLQAAARAEEKRGAVAVLLAGDAAVRTLNRQFRQKDAATNVLAFPPTPGQDGFLGDLALAYGVCAAEAQAGGRSLRDHAAHLLVHGLLHLLGYDHAETAQALAMEARERTILAGIGVADPYADQS